MFIVAGAALFAFVVSYAQLPQMLVHGLLGISDNKYVILFIILGNLTDQWDALWMQHRFF